MSSLPSTRNDLEADKQYPPVHTLQEVSAFFSLANFEAHTSQVTCNTSTNGFSPQKIVVIDKLSRANLEFTPQMIVSLARPAVGRMRTRPVHQGRVADVV